MTEDEIAQAVVLGAAWLDGKFGPEWQNLVDRNVLDMSSSVSCVLGQVFGRAYHLVLMAMEIWERMTRVEVRSFMISHGFDLSEYGRGQHAQLTAEWVRVIEARRMRVAG